VAREPGRASARPLRVNGWLLLFHAGFVGQLRTLVVAYREAKADDPAGFRSNANVKLLAAVARLVLDVVPADPTLPEYRQGNTLGKAYRDWFRVRFFQRFRLFFRYHSRARIIVFAWLNDDETTLRARGGRNDPYAVFRAKLERGDPPPDWDALVEECGPLSGTRGSPSGATPTVGTLTLPPSGGGSALTPPSQTVSSVCI
jgi:toxin YhaV